MDEKRTYLYEAMPVHKAVFTMAIPTVISQIISMVYNMADTFFIGRLGDPNQVAAVSIAAPASLVLTALANLFGIGGSALFSRAMGEHDEAKARRVSAFGFCTAAMVSLFISLVVAAFPGAVLRILGADDETGVHAWKYIYYVIVLAAPFSLLSMVMSHFVRADGAAKLAGYVLSAGGVLNLFLDPLLMFDWGLGMGIRGAAIATMISNIMTFAVFAAYFIRHRGSTAVSFSPKNYTLKREISLGVVSTGLPGMLQTLLASASNAVLNNLAGAFGGTAVAAMGIVKKLDQIPMSITIGFAQGIVPLVGYSYSRRNRERMQQILRFTLLMAVGFSAVCVAVYELFPAQLVSAFIRGGGETVEIGVPILRVMCVSTPLMAVAFIMITAFQASGRTKESTVLSVMRKGAIDIPLMLIFGALIPLQGLAFVQPVTECAAMLVALVFYRRAFGGKK